MNKDHLNHARKIKQRSSQEKGLFKEEHFYQAEKVINLSRKDPGWIIQFKSDIETPVQVRMIHVRTMFKSKVESPDGVRMVHSTRKSKKVKLKNLERKKPEGSMRKRRIGIYGRMFLLEQIMYKSND